MELFAQTQQKSRLGQILLDKRLVSQEQLSKAMEQQATTGERLGDILTQWNVVTQRHIESALRAQRTLRLVAYLTTATMAPFITACGGGGETSQPTQSSAAQPTTTAVAAASPSATESGAPSATPGTATGWVIKESVCCAPATASITTTASATNTARPRDETTTTQPVVAPVTTTAVKVTPIITTGVVVAPRLPTNLSAVAPSTMYVEISWSPSATSGVTYRIYRNGSAIALAEITGMSFFDTKVDANTGYTYRVTAVDADGNESALSNLAFILTPAALNCV